MKEDLSTKDETRQPNNFRKNLLWVSAVFFSLLATQAINYFSALYHDLYQSPQSALLVGLMYAVIFTLPVVVSVALFKSTKKTQFVGVVLLIFSIYGIIRSTYPNIRPLDGLAKIMLTGGAIVIAYAFVRRLSEGVKGRLISISLIVALLWMISTPLIGLYQRFTANAHLVAFDVRKIIPTPPKATVFLVLDELSPEFDQLIINALRADAHVLLRSAPLKAGKNTINAIPSMFTNDRHDDVIPCSSSQLCGRAGFSFNDVKAASPKTDVVGVWHPYCNAIGLRFCWRATFDQIVQPNERASVLIELLGKIPIVGRWFGSDRVMIELTEKVYSNLRLETERRAMQAPFWNQGGGLLYIHHLLPHPTGTGEVGSLTSEYHHNVKTAARFVEALVRRLQNNFGNDYAVIVTSDHPLRSFWCDQKMYKDDHCMADLPLEGDRVPLLALVPEGAAVHAPNSMVGALAD